MTIRFISSPDNHCDCIVQDVKAKYGNEKWEFLIAEKEDFTNFMNFLQTLNIKFMTEFKANADVDYSVIYVKANQNNFLII